MDIERKVEILGPFGRFVVYSLISATVVIALSLAGIAAAMAIAILRWAFN